MKFKQYLMERDFKFNKSILQQAEIDTKNCPYEHILTSVAVGVISDEPLKTSRYIKEIYPCYDKTRELIRKKYGDKITLYRIDPIHVKVKSKVVLFAPKEDIEIWKEYYEKELKNNERKITKKTVKVEDILAVYISSDYREIHVIVN